MPNKAKKALSEYHFWHVMLTSYPSEDAKRYLERVKGWEIPNEERERLSVKVSTVYRGWGERWAGVRFYRACRDGMSNPLANHVMMLRDGKIVAWVAINHTNRPGANGP